MVVTTTEKFCFMKDIFCSCCYKWKKKLEETNWKFTKPQNKKKNNKQNPLMFGLTRYLLLK